MSVDVKRLRAHGISSGNYRKIFTAPPEKRPKATNKLIDLIVSRVKDGRSQNLQDYRTFWAIDLAYEEPLNQTTATLVRNFLSHKWKDVREASEALVQRGLLESDVFLDVVLPDGSPAKIINPPLLVKTVMPIVQSYVKARLSKIFNERNQNPLLLYSPRKMSDTDRILCEIITDLVDTISANYGYPSVLHDAILQTLKYGICIAFPREEWHCETQLQMVDGVEKEVTVKEGLRYEIPHPSRTFRDMLYPAHTLNTNTGVEFAGHWHLKRYQDILDNRDYWNRKRITYGSNWFEKPLAKNYLDEVFPCQMAFPTLESNGNDRESRYAFYASGDGDKAVFVSEVFMKITPSQWGLGEYEDADLKKLVKTYNYPVWHRFTLAGDDTIIWAEPNAYVPPWFMGYDHDPNAARNSSLALECIPTQDQVGNLISQMLITTKQNLANVIFYDTNMVNKKDIEGLEYKGDRKLYGWNFIGFDGQKQLRAGNNPDKAFHPVQLQHQDIQQCLQMVNTTINLLERVLQITAQETGSAASHQQSREEIVQTGGASSNRLRYTASFIDEGIDAWKRQLVDGYRAYGDSGISAQVSTDIPNLDSQLETLGFTRKGDGVNKVVVSGTKQSLKLETFARCHEGPQIAENKEQSQVIFQAMAAIAAQPALAQAIGTKNILQIIEWAAILGGAPRGFKLNANETPQDQVPQAVQQAILQAQQATMQAIEQKIAQPVAKELAQDQQQLQSLQQIVAKFNGIFQTAEANQDKLKLKTAETEQKMQLRDEEFKREQARKDQDLSATIQREFKQLQTELQVMVEKAKADIATSTAVASAKIGLQKETAAAKQG